MSSTEDTKKEDTNELIDKDTLIYVGAGAGLLGLAGVLAMVGMNWMKEQDMQKKKLAMQDQMLRQRQQQDMLRQQRQRDNGQGWPNPIQGNTVQPSPPIMELPSEDREEEQFVGRQPITAYAGDQQKFLVTDDVVQQHRYPVIDPNATPQQIGNKISRVMSMDGNNVPQQHQQQMPPAIRSSSDDEDFSDLF